MSAPAQSFAALPTPAPETLEQLGRRLSQTMSVPPSSSSTASSSVDDDDTQPDPAAVSRRVVGANSPAVMAALQQAGHQPTQAPANSVQARQQVQAAISQMLQEERAAGARTAGVTDPRLRIGKEKEGTSP